MIRASVSSDREGVSATCPRVARAKLAGVGHRFGETEINRSHAAAFRLRCIESPAIRSILAHPFYSIRDIPYDKYLGLIFIRAKGPLPSPLRSAENLRSGDRGSDGFRDLWRLYLVIEFVLARLVGKRGRNGSLSRRHRCFDRIFRRIRFFKPDRVLR